MNTIRAHFTDNYLINPSNPLTVNLIGAGGTGSQMLSALARINQSLIALRHPGLMVRLFDSDRVSKANLGRQLFAASEVGQYKPVALINRLNRFFGTNWKALTYHYSKDNLSRMGDSSCANITITCVDTVAARFEIADMLRNASGHFVNRPIYWLDCGNSQYTGQVILATISPVKQPVSKKFVPVEHLPFITQEFEELLQQADNDTTPSCSLAEALTRQDLFINSSIANLGGSLLWSMLREGMTTNRGFFLNVKEFRSQPLKV